MTSTIPLPTFDGRLSSSFSLFESRLRSWFRIADTPDEETKRDILILCLKEPAAVWFDRQDNAKKADWESCVALLKGKYGTRNRMLTERKASANRLELRRFRDEKNEEEMVENLLDDLEDMMIRAGIEDDGIKKEILLGCFRDYNTAQKLLSQAQTFDEAVIQALKWEHNVIQKRTRPNTTLSIRDPNVESSIVSLPPSVPPSIQLRERGEPASKFSSSSNGGPSEVNGDGHGHDTENRRISHISFSPSPTTISPEEQHYRLRTTSEDDGRQGEDPKRNSFSYLSMLPTERDPDSPNFLSMNGESGGNSRRNSSKITSTSSASSKIRQRSSSSDLRGSSVAAALDPIRERRVSLNSSTFGMGNARTDAIRDSILSYNAPSEREPHPFSAAAIREESFLSGSPASSPVMSRDPSHDEPTPLPSSHQMQRKLSELTYRMPSNSVSSHMTPVPIRTSLVESRAIAKEDNEMSPVASSSIRDIQQRYPSSHFHHSRLPAVMQGDMHTIETLHTPRPSSLSDDPFRRSPMMISEDSLVGGDREVISSNGHSRYSERDWRHSMNMDMEERDDVTDLVSTQGTSRRRKLHRKGHSQRNSASFGPEPNFSSPDFGKGHPGKGGSLSRLFHWRGNRDQ